MMLAAPQVEIPVAIFFNLATAIERELIIDVAGPVHAREHIDPATNPDEQKV